MKRRSMVFLLILLMLAPVITLNCSRDDVAIVRIQLKNLPPATAVNSNAFFERIFRWFVPSAYASWNYPNIDLKVVLSAPDLFDITVNMPLDQSSITLEVPAGPQRRITVYGYTDYTETVEKTWGGHVELDLNPGDEVDAQIDMLPVVTAGVFQEGTAYVNWSPVSADPLFGIQGYHVYRSDTGSEGPYHMVGTADGGIAAGYFYDWSIDPEKTFHYAVSVFTNELEGELSDPCLYQPALIIGNIQ